jgi:hypothetical protein
MQKRGKNDNSSVKNMKTIKSKLNLDLNKKKIAQISVFIIIAIILVAIIALLFTVFLKPKIPVTTKSGELGSIKQQIFDCQSQISKEALKTIGIQGGYYNKPKYFHSIDWAFIPYYYYQGEYYMPQKNVVQDELSNYVNDFLKPCIQKINVVNYKIVYEQPKTITAISPGKVVFTVNSPMSLISGEETTKLELKDSPVVINSSLYYILEVADYITRTHKDDPNFVCINCVVDMAKERNLYVDMMEYPNLEKSTLVMISENYTSPEPYIFEFLNKY